MSKIICDVCGTTFPETADQCPICGCAKPENPQIVQENAPRTEKASGSYTYVKGGRFSKSNVKKRNKAAGLAQEDFEQKPEKSNRGLVIAIVLLLLAIIAFVFYIVLTYFTPGTEKPHDTAAGTTDPMQSSTDTSPVQTTDADAPCTELELSVDTIELDEEGDTWLLNAIPVPENTTDALSFSSSDTNVATVTQEGRVVAVGPGEAVITVTCGEITAQCSVKCSIASVTTEPSETTADTIDPSVSYDLFIDGKNVEGRKYKNEVTISVGDSFALTLRNGAGEIMDVKWVASEDNICKIEGNTITGAAGGNITISVTVGDEKYTCKVHVNGPPPETDDAETGTNTDSKAGLYINGTNVESRRYKNEVTLNEGESFILAVKGADGKTVDIQWSVSEDDICTIDGNAVTGKTAGNVTISATYEGTTYTCILHVKGNS